ncbi:hypothetical protein GGR55DRAFT_503186 [Xylaria sp. FL0064]|nr:hypothetical protein GGR55DRAFT_503186 [Xylaria sp. FL0064]
MAFYILRSNILRIALAFLGAYSRGSWLASCLRCVPWRCIVRPGSSPYYLLLQTVRPQDSEHPDSSVSNFLIGRDGHASTSHTPILRVVCSVQSCAFPTPSPNSLPSPPIPPSSDARLSLSSPSLVSSAESPTLAGRSIDQLICLFILLSAPPVGIPSGMGLIMVLGSVLVAQQTCYHSISRLSPFSHISGHNTFARST